MSAAPGSPPSGRARATVLSVVIAALLTSGGVLVLARETPPAYAPRCDTAPQTHPTESPIRHLFVVIKENHAFENYFGAYAGVLGNPPNGSFPTRFGANTTVRPFALTGSSTPDLPHDHASELIDEDNGRNDLFVAQAAASGATDPSAAVGYYGPSQVPQYYAYAHAYALGDRFFSGYLGPTAPNRDFDLAATTDGQTTDTQPPAGSLQAPTILGQLTSAGVPWAYDYTGTSTNLTPLEFRDVESNACAVGAVTPFSSFVGQVDASVPPSVVFIDPSHDPVGPTGLDGFSEHPPDNVSLGAQWTTAVVNAIFSSPIASSSAVLLFYDEAGGFWDPMTPPVVDGNPDGFRIPFLVLSAYTPAGLLVDETLDPAAVLAFIDWNWRLPALNARVADSPGLNVFFSFGGPPRAPLLLSTPINLSPSGGESGRAGESAVRGPLATMLAVGPAGAPTRDGTALNGPTRATGVCHREPLRMGPRSGSRGRSIVLSASSPRDRVSCHHPIRIGRHGPYRAPRTAQRA